MARRAQPWYRADRKIWCVTINGTRHNLGPKKKAFDRFHALMRQPRRQKVVADSVAAIMDAFLDWVDRNRSAATYEWYRYRLQDFVDKHPQLTIEELRPHHVEKWAGLPRLAQTSRRNLMRAVKRSLKWAVAQGYIESSPIAHMEVPGGEAREAYVAREDEFSRYQLKPGDVLMTEGGDWDKLGRAAIWRNEILICIHQNHIYRIRSANSEELLPEWIMLFANSPLGRSYFEGASKQTTNLASINMTQLRSCPLPLPPSPEQRRIVAKVDELMKLCDQLESQLTTTQTETRRLLEAILHEALAPAEIVSQ